MSDAATLELTQANADRINAKLGRIEVHEYDKVYVQRDGSRTTITVDGEELLLANVTPPDRQTVRAKQLREHLDCVEKKRHQELLKARPE